MKSGDDYELNEKSDKLLNNKRKMPFNDLMKNLKSKVTPEKIKI